MQTSETSSTFVYFLVSEGNDQFLKEELKRVHPELKLAYSRKTFLTYKSTDGKTSACTDLGVVFSFSNGVTIGRANSENLLEKIGEVLGNEIFKNKPILNSFECEVEYLEVKKQLGDRFKQGDFQNEDLVFELVKSHENEFYFGVHAYGPHRTVLNDYSKETVPSRAYFKIKEAFQLMNLKPKAGERALDLGASPGGASYYFLQHGLHVVAVDPKKMDEACTSNPKFEHHQIQLEYLNKTFLRGKKFDWISIDINLDPLYVSHELERVLAQLSEKPKGLFFTVKQTKNFSRERIPEFVQIVEKLGFKNVVTKQVPSDRSEFLLYAEGKNE